LDDSIEKKVIVIVEDNDAIAELIKDTLNAEPDYQAVAVSDGSLALEVIHSVKASLILLDVMLPGIDGLQLYDVLKADPETENIPVVFVTATKHETEFKSRRIETYISKPFDLTELLDHVARVCRPQ